MSNFSTKMASFFKNAASRTLRYIGIAAIIYASAVFYLALTERRNAFPRAIYHKEANEAIQNRAQKLTCLLQDGIILNGFSLGKEGAPVLLYFPEADEDAAQFLAQIDTLPGINVVTFNYRGSAQNKGTPSEENFESDGKSIVDCATQVNKTEPKYLIGRGIGAILAAKEAKQGQKVIFIDPVFDIAEAISQKYGVLYPKFLVRTNFKADLDKFSADFAHVNVIFDKKINENKVKEAIEPLKKKNVTNRSGGPLAPLLLQEINKNLF